MSPPSSSPCMPPCLSYSFPPETQGQILSLAPFNLSPDLCNPSAWPQTISPRLWKVPDCDLRGDMLQGAWLYVAGDLGPASIALSLSHGYKQDPPRTGGWNKPLPYDLVSQPSTPKKGLFP